MKAIVSTAVLTALLGTAAFAQDKKAEAPKPPAKAEAAPQTKQLSASQVYALQKASESLQLAQQKKSADEQRDSEDLKAAQQTLQTVGSSVQQDCGCRITQQGGKLVGVVEPAKK